MYIRPSLSWHSFTQAFPRKSKRSRFVEYIIRQPSHTDVIHFCFFVTLVQPLLRSNELTVFRALFGGAPSGQPLLCNVLYRGQSFTKFFHLFRRVGTGSSDIEPDKTNRCHRSLRNGVFLWKDCFEKRCVVRVSQVRDTCSEILILIAHLNTGCLLMLTSRRWILLSSPLSAPWSPPWPTYLLFQFDMFYENNCLYNFEYAFLHFGITFLYV